MVEPARLRHFFISRSPMSHSVDLIDIEMIFGQVRAVEKFSASVEGGEFFSILGPSGCGKTTILRLVAVSRGSAPKMRITPFAGLENPASMRSRVVFPAPLRPMSAVQDPGSTRNPMSRSAG